MEILENVPRLKKYYEQYQMERFFEKDILKEAKLIKINRLEYICFQEEPLEYLSFIVDGRAKVVKDLANGKTLLISFYEPLEVIGDVELIQNIPAVCTVQALDTCYIIAFPIEKCRAVLQKDIKLLNFICKALAEKLDQMSNNSSINLLYPLENRLASYMDKVAVELEEYKNLRCFNDNLTQLAELLGSSYRHLLRTLNGLCQKEILSRQKEGYIIINEEKLKRLAGALYK